MLALVAPGPPCPRLAECRAETQEEHVQRYLRYAADRKAKAKLKQGVQVFRPRQRRRLQPPRVLLRAWTWLEVL